MDGKQLYMLACRFPKEAIPAELRPSVPRVSYDEKLGWTGKYWYYVSGNAVPRMYAKLHLPDGLWLAGNSHLSESEIQLIFSPDRVPNKEIFRPLWFGEMVKGVRMGTPELAELCVNTLAKFGLHAIV